MAGGYSYSIDSRDLETLLRRVRETGPLVEAVNNAMKSTSLAVEAEARKRAPVGVSGRLQGDIHTAFGPATPLILEARIGPRVPYAAAVEYGTSPHWPDMAEGGSFWEWVRLKALKRGVRPKRGLKANAELKSAVFLIARKISRAGTEGHHYMLAGFQTGAELAPAIFGDIGRRFGEQLTRGK